VEGQVKRGGWQILLAFVSLRSSGRVAAGGWIRWEPLASGSAESRWRPLGSAESHRAESCWGPLLHFFLLDIVAGPVEKQVSAH
jgi:hypothetical protein